MHWTISWMNSKMAEMLTIKHTVTAVSIGGQRVIVEKDRAKNKSSLRSLPLEPAFKDLLFDLKMRQERFRSLCKKSYNKEFLDYIYVDEMGNRIKPDYISAAFPKFLEKNGMRKIRFHDLRHSCASLLLSIGVSMKQIQEWLGHTSHKKRLQSKKSIINPVYMGIFLQK
jgi:integrase